MVGKQARRGDTRERILDAAMDVFVEEGFAGATISEVERRVGLAVGTGSLYRHFPSKLALLHAATEREVARYREQMDEARQKLKGIDDPKERRMAVYKFMLNDLERFDRLFRLMLNEGDRVPELREAIWKATQRPASEAQRDTEVVGAIAASALAGYHLFSLMQGQPFNEIDEDEFLRTLVEITHRPTKG